MLRPNRLCKKTARAGGKPAVQRTIGKYGSTSQYEYRADPLTRHVHVPLHMIKPIGAGIAARAAQA
jgi:hypothetical protein